MSEKKTCWDCKFRVYSVNVKPCSECEDELHDFTVYSKWEKGG